MSTHTPTPYWWMAYSDELRDVFDALYSGRELDRVPYVQPAIGR
jgi:hypothetical protein